MCNWICMTFYSEITKKRSKNQNKFPGLFICMTTGAIYSWTIQGNSLKKQNHYQKRSKENKKKIQRKYKNLVSSKLMTFCSLIAYTVICNSCWNCNCHYKCLLTTKLMSLWMMMVMKIVMLTRAIFIFRNRANGSSIVIDEEEEKKNIKIIISIHFNTPYFRAVLFVAFIVHQLLFSYALGWWLGKK